MPKQKDYEVGQEPLYGEWGTVYKVEVLENTGNKAWARYELAVLEVRRSSQLGTTRKVGSQFSCAKKRTLAGVSDLWYLLDDD